MTRRCKQCKEVELEPAGRCTDIIEKKGFCSVECLTLNTRSKIKSKADKERRAKSRQDKERIKTRHELVKEAQKEFNRFVRLRDYDQSCICCGKWADESWKTGGSWDAGHFLSVGAHPELRFVEINCHKQLKSCNAGESKHAIKRKTVTEGYTDRLPSKIGQEAFDWLTGPHDPKNYTHDELREIRRIYREKANKLQKLIEPE